MVTLARRAARIPFAPVVAVMFGTVAAILVVAMPQGVFESAVSATGLPSMAGAATPPLGLTARLLAILAAFGAVAGVLWLTLGPVVRWIEKRGRAAWRDEGYEKALDEAPARRRPIFAPAELGAPLMSDEAIAAPPLMEVEPELEAPLSAVEFDLPPSSEPEDSSIQGLIRRLEAGLARRASAEPDPDAPDALPLLPDWIVEEPKAAESHESPAIWDEDSDPSLRMRRLAWR